MFLNVNVSVTLYQYRARVRSLETNLSGRAIFWRIVPASELFGILKFQYYQALRLPIALYGLSGPAARQEFAAVCVQGWTNQCAILRVHSWVFYVDINNEVGCHRCFLPFFPQDIFCSG